MTICDRHAVAIVPFPFVDHPVVKRRPALVLSTRDINRRTGQTVLAMITSAARSAWTTDISISDLGAAGLRARSIVRLKVFTLANSVIAGVAGQLASADSAAVDQLLRNALNL